MSVVVTGATGFVGAQVFRQLLDKGYKVRGTVRSQDKGEKLKQKYPQYKDQIEYAVVDDIAKPGAFDEAFKGATIVHHVASPFHMKLTDAKKDYLDPAINGTINALESAKKAGTVKRVVITSSFAAIHDASKVGPYVYTEKDWNPITYETAAQSTVAGVVYSASKKLAEKAAYDFVEQNKPIFDIVTLNPPMIFGPMEQDVTLSSLNESVQQVYDVVTSKSGIPPTRVPLFVDVRDVAKAHVAAQEIPAVGGNRFFLFSQNFLWEDIVDIARRNFPEKADLIAQPNAGGERPPFEKQGDSSKAKKQFGIEFISLEKSIVDLLTQIFSLPEK